MFKKTLQKGEDHQLATARSRRDRMMLLPAMIVMVAFAVYPMIYLVYTSLYYYVYTMPSSRHFVGLKNFLDLISDPDFRKTLFNTAFILGGSLLIEMVVGIGLGLVFARQNLLTKLGRVLLILPMATSPIVASQVWYLMFESSGPLNYYLGKLGLGNVVWLSNTWTARYAIIIADFWEWTPFVILIVCTAVMGVSKEFVEAARIDGATKIEEIRYVTLPTIKSALSVAFLFRLVDLFRNFDLVFGLTYGGPGYATETLGMAIYRAGFFTWSMGKSAAMSVIMMIITGLIGSQASKRLLKDVDKEEG